MRTSFVLRLGECNTLNLETALVLCFFCRRTCLHVSWIVLQLLELTLEFVYFNL